jgi:aminoglycoside 6'-N-acetyltransferase
MHDRDLGLVGDWLLEPHVARWWLAGTTREAELETYRTRVTGEPSATRMLMVLVGGRPVGWCQWYRWGDYPAEARATGARADEAGIDYAIGEPALTGRGVGTALVGALVAEVRGHVPGAGVVSDPAAANVASRRVLEKNGFALVAIRPVETEPVDEPMAIYRLAGLPGGV